MSAAWAILLGVLLGLLGVGASYLLLDWLVGMTKLRLCWLILRGRPVAYRLKIDGALLMPPGDVEPVQCNIYPRGSGGRE